MSALTWLPTSDTSRAEAAALYAENGLRVVPLHHIRHDGSCSCGKCAPDEPRRGKHPRLRKWQEKASCEPPTVAGWWKQWRDANVGLLMGNGLVAVDIDGEPGRASLATIRGEREMPSTLTSTTGRGEHCLFRLQAHQDATRFGNQTSVNGWKGIDTRGEGGQIVVAPSVHYSGAQYTWSNCASIAEMPDWLFEQLAVEDAPKAPATKQATVARLPTATPSKLNRARAYLAKCEPAIQGSNGSTTTFNVALKLFTTFDFEEGTVLDLLWSAYNPRCQPPWTAEELEHKVADAARHATRDASNSAGDYPAAWDETAAADSEDETSGQQSLESSTTAPKSESVGALASMVPLLPYDELFTPEPDAKLAVPALGICAGPINGFIGESYVGKSVSCAFSLGLAVASGSLLWGAINTTRGRWLHLDHEQGRRQTKRYITRLMNGMGLTKEQMRGRFDVAIYPKLNLTHGNAEALYTELFRGYDIVTLDAMRGMLPGVDENSTEVRDYLDMLSRASEATGCVVVLIHHAGKPQLAGARERKHMARGASAIRDALQSMFVLTGAKGQPIHVSHEKDRELGLTVDDFALEIVDVAQGNNPKWGLAVRQLSPEELAVRRAGQGPDPMTLKRERGAEERRQKDEAKKEESRQKSEAKAQARRGRALAEDRALVSILRAEPGIGSRDLRAAMAVALEGCSQDAIDATLARLGPAVGRKRGARNSVEHSLVEEHLSAHLRGPP